MHQIHFHSLTTRRLRSFPSIAARLAGVPLAPVGLVLGLLASAPAAAVYHAPAARCHHDRLVTIGAAAEPRAQFCLDINRRFIPDRNIAPCVSICVLMGEKQDASPCTGSTIYMTDLTVGDGGQYATVAAAMVAWQPGDTIDLDSSNQTVTLGSGDFQLVVNGAGNTITMGRGNDSVTLNGSGNVVATGALQNVIRENGPGGNTIVTRAPGTGVNDIFGNAIQNGDILDLRATLAATSWDGDPSHLAAYFHITQVGTMARLNVSLVPGGHQYLVATFENAP
ncbi:MAG TPA: hypothetical protein VFW75_17300, partial [Acetobacteraceae bacterium]|nr:hypothetical protein [Acetobacteraceae bacterium]